MAPKSKSNGLITSAKLFDTTALAAAFLLPLATYLRTLAPAEVGGDAGEFQYVPAILGIPHYTGYPLYTLLGHLWVRLDPLGTPALKMNALSAVCGALACALVYLGVRTLGGGRLAGLAGAAALAVAPLEWRWSTIAGVRAAAAAFTALVLVLAFRWETAARLRPDAKESTWSPHLAVGTCLRNRWFWLCFAVGLALTHHRSSAFFLPALLVYVLLIAPRFLRRWRLLLAGALIFALPLLLYLYLPIRSAQGTAYDQFHPTTWANFAELVFAPQLSRSLLSIAPSDYPARALSLGQALLGQLGPFTWFAALGLAIALRYRRAELVAGGIFGLLVCAQVIDWNIPGGLNVVYLIPVMVVCAYLVAAGAEWMVRLGTSDDGRVRRLIGRLTHQSTTLAPTVIPAGARASRPPRWRRMVAAVGGNARRPSGVGAGGTPALRPGAGYDGILPAYAPFAATFVTLLTLLALAHQGRWTYEAQQAAARLPLDAYHQDLTAGWRGHRLAAAALPYLAPQAVIAADWEQATIFWYQKLVAKTLADATVEFGDGSLADLSPALLAQRYPDRPVYLARSVPWAAGHHPSAAGPLISLSDSPRRTSPPGITPLPTALEGGFALVGYQLFDEQGRRVTAVSPASPVLPIMLVWRAEQRQTQNLSVSLRLLDASGSVARSVDSSSPVYGLAPTTTWATGEVVSDYYELSLDGLPHGAYHLEALLYYQPTPGTFQNLQVLGPAGVPAGTGIHLVDVNR